MSNYGPTFPYAREARLRFGTSTAAPMVVWPTFHPSVRIGDAPDPNQGLLGQVLDVANQAVQAATSSTAPQDQPAFNQGDPRTAASANASIAVAPAENRPALVAGLDVLASAEQAGVVPPGTTQQVSDTVTGVAASGGALALPSDQAAAVAAAVPGAVTASPHPTIPGVAILTWAENWLSGVLRWLGILGPKQSPAGPQTQAPGSGSQVPG